MKETWKVIDFTKIGFAADIPGYEVSYNGLVRKKLKKGWKIIGSYGPKKSRFKYLNIEIQIKFAIASVFCDYFDFNKHNVHFKDGDVKNCCFDNLDIVLKPKFRFVPPSENQYNLYCDLLENGSLDKMAGYTLMKYNFYPVAFFDNDDAKQDLISYCYYNLHQFDEKKYKSFDQFIFFKMYDRLIKIIKMKSKHTNFSIESIFDKFRLKGFNKTDSIYFSRNFLETNLYDFTTLY